MNDSKKSMFEHEVMPQMQALYAMALKYTHSEAEAQELVQVTMIKAYRCFDSFEAGTNCRAWLFRIMSNTFINEYRRYKRELNCLDMVTDEAARYLETVINMPDKSLERDEANLQKRYSYCFSDELMRALDAISAELKSIIVMADLLDFSYKEIAEKLHIPIGTVMSRLSRGRQMLKKLLSDYAGDLGYCVDA